MPMELAAKSTGDKIQDCEELIGPEIPAATKVTAELPSPNRSKRDANRSF